MNVSGSKVLIAIDPGVSGGIAYQYEGCSVQAAKMPKTPKDIYDTLKMLSTDHYSHCILENVGGYRSGNSAISAVKFARHVGHLEMALLACCVPITRVAPSKWMKGIVSTVPKPKTERKNKIKAVVQDRYPHLKVTLDTADALGMLLYAKLDTELHDTLFSGF